MAESKYRIHGINGPVITVMGTTEFFMREMVYVGNKKLIGEVILINEQFSTIQVYEDTSGLYPGEPVERTHKPMSVKLGPGILSNIFDGIQRPLKDIAHKTGAFIDNGIEVNPLPVNKKWKVTLKVKVGDKVSDGQIYATLPETSLIEHRCLVPIGCGGEVISAVSDGEYYIDDEIIKIKDNKGNIHTLTLCQYWPIRQARKFIKREPISKPLITGQRVIDTLFPIAKGGAAAVPGGFGTGKTLTQHQLAKWSDADIIVYVGCGERGNEMTQVLTEFSELIDPKSGKPLTDRTVLIANTSNMPVAAREASIYTGITLAEYYRDMGYHVAIMADSTSRWAEALREISGRLEEMPAEEGYPAYLSSRLSEFYERAGYVRTLNGSEGSITIIGAVSPQGGDFSEPVTQNTKRYIRTFLALDRSLAYSRHYPAINWTTSYSDYIDDLRLWFEQNVNYDFLNLRERLTTILTEETRLMEIVKLIGADVLPDSQRLIIETARIIRVGFLQQNAYHAQDTYVPLQKQFLMMKTIIYFYDKAMEIVNKSIPLSLLAETGIYDKIIRMKYDIPNDNMEKFEELKAEIKNTVDDIIEKNSF